MGQWEKSDLGVDAFKIRPLCNSRVPGKERQRRVPQTMLVVFVESLGFRIFSSSVSVWLHPPSWPTTLVDKTGVLEVSRPRASPHLALCPVATLSAYSQKSITELTVQGSGRRSATSRSCVKSSVGAPTTHQQGKNNFLRPLPLLQTSQLECRYLTAAGPRTLIKYCGTLGFMILLPGFRRLHETAGVNMRY